jgi:hypothetical protein
MTGERKIQRCETSPERSKTRKKKTVSVGQIAGTTHEQQCSAAIPVKKAMTSHEKGRDHWN